METIAEKPQTARVMPTFEAVPEVVKTEKRKYFNLGAQAREFEKARFGWMAMLITIQSCLGAVACLFISMDPSAVAPLAIGAAVTMGSNALFIALAPPKICLVGFYVSVLANTVLIVLAQI